MHNRLRLLATGVAALSSTLALAQPRMKPGLWEEALTLKTDNAQANAAMEQMKARLAAMPPDQRAAVEKMMAGHGVGMGAGGGNTLRVCVTQEQIDRGFRPEDDGHCSRSNVSTSGGTTSFDFACKSERGSVTGHGSFIATSDTAFTSSTAADRVTPKGTMHVQSDVAGKFVSSDCGDVKPVATPAGK
jgi:hypothetical protein